MKQNARKKSSVQLLPLAALLGLVTACDITLNSAEGQNTPAAAPSAQVLTVPDEFTAVVGRTVGQNLTPVLDSDGRWLVVYELLLLNGKEVPASVASIEVLDFNDSERVIRELTGEELLSRSAGASARPRSSEGAAVSETGAPVLQPNEAMVIFIELEFDSPEAMPDAIVHRLSGAGATNPGSREASPIQYLMVPKPLLGRDARVIGSPLAGDHWVAVNGCCSTDGAHRGSIHTVSGELFDSQRFAIDFMKIGENGMFYDGDPTEVSNWYNYGEPVYAVADATVVETLNDLDDQPVGSLPEPGSITMKTVDGNHVILDLGDGIYAFYAHLKKGSVRVKSGDVVRRGEQLGELGNSGNTSGPHLHLHLMDRASAISSDSYPYVFDDVEIKGRVDRQQWEASTIALDDVWLVNPTHAEMGETPVYPLDLDVIAFPGPVAD